MPKYIAFLRAINVGSHTVKMDYLRQLFESMGFSKVETFIASGNVIFDSKSTNTKALAKKIEECLEKKLGYPVATFIRSTSDLARIAQYRAFGESDLNTNWNLYIGFVADGPNDQSKQKLLSFVTDVDDFRVNGLEVYWLCRTNIGESRFSYALLEKTFGMQATFRNSTTVRKLASKYP